MQKARFQNKTNQISGIWILRSLLIALVAQNTCQAFLFLPTAKTVAMYKMRKTFVPVHVENLKRQQLLATTTSLSSTNANFQQEIVTSQLLSVDLSAQVSDGLQAFVFVLVGIVVLLAAASTYVTQSLIPGQMDKLSILVAQEKPEAYEKIAQQLEEGQRLKDRPDLIAQLVEAGVDLMKDEKEEEMEFLVQLLRKEMNKNIYAMGAKEEREQNLESIIKVAESSLGMSKEDFVAKVDKNTDSKYLTESAKELADLLR